MDKYPAIKAEEFPTEIHEEAADLDTDEEAAQLDLDEEELALQLRLLQNRRKRLENEAKRRKRTAWSSGPHPARSVSHTPEIKQRSTTPYEIPPSALIVEILSDDEKPQVKTEAEENSSTGTGFAHEAVPPAEEDATITDATNVAAPEQEKDQHPKLRLTVRPSRTTRTQGACKPPATDRKQKTQSVPITRTKQPRLRKNRKTPNIEAPRSASKPVRTNRNITSQSRARKQPITPTKKRLTIQEQLTQELEDLCEDSPSPASCGRGGRTRPPAGTYREPLGPTEEDIQTSLSHFCMLTVDHVCFRLSQSGQGSLDEMDAIFDGPRQRLVGVEYSSIEEFVKDIKSILKNQICRDCDKRYISRYLYKQQGNWEECKEECETRPNEEEWRETVCNWAVVAEKG